MDIETPSIRTTGQGPQALFLLELREPHLTYCDLPDIHQALRHAATRFEASGDAVTWTATIFVPDDARCLWFLEARAESDVVRIRDTAGLLAASIHLVHPLSEGKGPWPHPPTPAQG